MLPRLDQDASLQIAEFAAGLQTLSKKSSAREPSLEVVGAMRIALCLLALGGVVAQPPPEGPENPDLTQQPSGSKDDSAASSSGSSGEATWATAGWTSGSSGTGSYANAGYSSGSGWGNVNWGSVGGSGSGWDWSWGGGDSNWDPNSELWHFRPSWNWDSPYPPVGTMYIENWGNPPTRDVPSRRSFYLGAENGVSLAGATVEGGRADCGWRDWCVHLAFHSSYGVLSDFDAFVLDRYDSADRIYGDGLWYAREDEEGAPRAFAPLVLGGFSPEERAVLGNISSWRVEEMARRFNETRTTTWTLYPDSDEMDVVLSFKQLYTLLPGYPDGNVTRSSLNSEIITEWGPADQVLLRVTAKRQGSGATSSIMPRVLNFTGSQLFQVEYFSSLEYPQDDDGNLNASANAMTLDVVFNRRRYGSGLPWNPARPSDACDACNQRVMNHPVVARCLHGNVPERIFQDIYEQSASEQMEWDGGEWAIGDNGAPTNLSYNLNDMVDACFGLRWLLSGQTNDGSWSSGSGFPDAGDRRSSSGSGYGDAGFGWSSPGSGSDGDFRYNDAGSRRSSEPVYRYDESGSRWSSWGYRDDGSASRFGDVGSRWSSSGSSGGPDVGDWPSVRDLRTALAIARETDAGIQCFVESRCPVGTRSFAEAAGRMVVLEHESAFVRVNFSEPSYTFYVWMELEGLGPETEFRTPDLSSDNTPEEIAELVAGAVPNATEYNLAVDVHKFDNSELIAWINMLNEWMANYYKSGGSESEASAAWAAYSSSADGGSSFQFPPVGEASGSGYYSNVGQQSHTDSVDGSSPDAGQDGGSARWWFGEPLPVPEPQFTVQISFRNVSVVPSIIEVIGLSDESMDGDGKSKMSFDYRRSELRFQLSPLNLTKFEYVPPPPYVNLTWDEDIPDYPDLYWNGSSIWNGTDIWSICSECEDAYAACDNSTSCSLGVRGFLEGALSPSRFDAYELSTETDSYNRRPWGVDFGPKLRQSASFFTAEGYDLFMNFMVCLKKPDCTLDLPRQAYNYSQGEYVTVEPTQLEVTPAESVFVVPTTTTGDLENLVMKFRGKEYVLEWANWTYDDLAIKVQGFVNRTMYAYSEDSIWARNPSQNAWVNVDYESDYGRDGEYLGQLFRLRFEDNFFIDAEQPRFRPVSSDTYDELNTSNWKVNAYAYRNLYDEGIWDGYPLVTWRKLTNWLSDLGYNSSDFSRPLVYGDVAEEDINICHQCMDAWTQCISNPSCADAMRQNVIYSMLYPMVYSNEPDQRSSMDFSARLALWRENTESEVYASVLEFLSCLSKEDCPVGYAFPSDPSESLVPVTTELVSHFAVNVPLDRAISAYTKGYSLEFVPGTTPTSDMENWLEAAANYMSDVKVQSTLTNDTSIRFEVTYYPAVAATPTFYFPDDATSLTLEGPMTFASLQLSSNRVQYGQSMSISLLESWFSAYLDTGKMFYSSVDIFRGTQVCHGCPECWEALTRCQNDMDCDASARDVLVPLLRNATLPVLTSAQSNGQTQVRLDLSLALLSLENDAFQSREGWLAFAHLLRAISSCGCEVGFGYWGSSGYVEPTRVRIESDSVDVSVRLYPNTQLDVWFDGNIFSYSSDGASSPNDAANNFLNWFTTTANSEPFYLVVDHVDTIVDDMSQSATVTMKLYQVYDVDSESQPLVNPNWIPNFVVTSDDVSVVPPAEVTVSPWKIYLQSVDRYPVFDRLLDLLEYGAVSDEMPSSSSGSWGSSSNGNWAWSTSGSDASGSFSGDACARCADLRQACFDDMECQSAIGDYLLPTLETMSSWDTPDGFWYDMTSQILSNVFGQMQSSEPKRKLFALLTCSATEWTSTASQEGDSCVQLQAYTQYPDGNVSLDIIPAFSVFPITQGQERTIYTGPGNPMYPMGTAVYYSDNGDAAELADFMENQILGGYDYSGVRVKVSADWGSEMYNIIYDGLTATSTPLIEGETSSSPTQFKFFGSTPDLVGIFRPWMQWLDPTLSK